MKKHFSKDGKTVHPLRPDKRKKHHPPGIETEQGITVRSQYEKAVVSLLTEHKLRFCYEPLMLLDGRQYRPDFFLLDHNLFIEICGMTHLPYYRDRVAHKKKLYAHAQLQAVFISGSSVGEIKRNLIDTLKNVKIIT